MTIQKVDRIHNIKLEYTTISQNTEHKKTFTPRNRPGAAPSELNNPGQNSHATMGAAIDRYFPDSALRISDSVEREMDEEKQMARDEYLKDLKNKTEKERRKKQEAINKEYYLKEVENREFDRKRQLQAGAIRTHELLKRLNEKESSVEMTIFLNNRFFGHNKFIREEKNQMFEKPLKDWGTPHTLERAYFYTPIGTIFGNNVYREITKDDNTRKYHEEINVVGTNTEMLSQADENSALNRIYHKLPWQFVAPPPTNVDNILSPGVATGANDTNATQVFAGQKIMQVPSSTIPPPPPLRQNQGQDKGTLNPPQSKIYESTLGGDANVNFTGSAPSQEVSAQNCPPATGESSIGIIKTDGKVNAKIIWQEAVRNGLILNMNNNTTSDETFRQQSAENTYSTQIWDSPKQQQNLKIGDLTSASTPCPKIDTSTMNNGNYYKINYNGKNHATKIIKLYSAQNAYWEQDSSPCWEMVI